MKVLPVLLLSGVAVATQFVGCSENGSLDAAYPKRIGSIKAGSTRFGETDFGVLPKGTGDSTGAQFVSLLDDNGSMREAEVLIDTKLEIGDAEQHTCPLKEGTRVLMVAKKGEKIIVNLKSPCIVDGKEFKEGLVKEVTLLEVSPSKEFVPTSGTTAKGTGSTSTSVVSTPTPTPTPVPLSGCSTASQILIKGAGKSVDQSRDRYDGSYDQTANFDDRGCSTDQLIKDSAQGSCGLPGNSFRRGGITENGDMMAFRVEGSAVKWRVQSKWDTKTFDVSKTKTANENVHVIPFPEVIPVNTEWGGNGTEYKFQFTGLDASGNPVGKVCEHSFRVVSPIVLHLTRSTRFTTRSVTASNVRFDIDADGKNEQVGWINPDSGFLALDVNGNGRIDDGSELFGEAMNVRGEGKAKNGYEALAQFDGGKKGFVDASDPVFHRLLVWTDLNSNGKSDKGELKTLAEVGITKISTRFEPVAKPSGDALFANDVRYRSVYFGPAICGTFGCDSFDVFFGTFSERSMLATR